MNANDAIEHFKETLNFNPNSHKIRFYNADSLNVEKYLAKNKKGVKIYPKLLLKNSVNF